ATWPRPILSTLGKRRFSPCQDLFTIMAIQNLSAIENMLSQMRAVAQAASSSPSSSSKSSVVNNGGFAAELARSLDRVSTLQNDSAAQARSFQMGSPDISLN